MKWIAHLESGDRRFEIKRDEKAGFYLYVYVGELCTHDYLQDSLEQAIAVAERQFAVPRSAWHPE
jgi:hypothetical protein